MNPEVLLDLFTLCKVFYKSNERVSVFYSLYSMWLKTKVIFFYSSSTVTSYSLLGQNVIMNDIYSASARLNSLEMLMKYIH